MIYILRRKKVQLRLIDDKAAEADDLLPRFLNSIKNEIISLLVMIFRKVLNEETVPTIPSSQNKTEV